MSIQPPICECVDDVREQNRLTVSEGFRRVVSDNTGNKDRCFAVGKDIERFTKERLWLGRVVREVKVCKDAEDASQHTL